ncbi:MAG: hypothetical protein ACRCZZ_09795 [Phocaeicola sp.]
MKTTKEDIDAVMNSVLKPALLMDYCYQTLGAIKGGLKQREKQLAKEAFRASSKYFKDLFRDMGTDSTCLLCDKFDEFNDSLAKHIQTMKYSFQEELMNITTERRTMLSDVISVNVVAQLAGNLASALCGGRKDFEIERVRKFTDELMDEISNNHLVENSVVDLKGNDNITLAVEVFIKKTLQFKSQ